MMMLAAPMDRRSGTAIDGCMLGIGFSPCWSRVDSPETDRKSGQSSAILVLSLKSLPAHEFGWSSTFRRALRRVWALQEMRIHSATLDGRRQAAVKSLK